MTKKEIIENKIFTEDQLKKLIEKCQEWYKLIMDFNIDSSALPPHYLSSEIKDIKNIELAIYEMLPYNVTVQFDKNYPDKISFCVFLYDGGEHHIMKEFRIDAYKGEIIR